jgi:hypothetical protein
MFDMENISDSDKLSCRTIDFAWVHVTSVRLHGCCAQVAEGVI